MAMTTEEFAERVFGSMLGAFEFASIYLGERLGYYDALHGGGALTPAELAERTGTVERYAREWLEQQASVGFLAVDDPGAEPHARRFSLPEGHAAVLADPDSGAYQAAGARMFVSAMSVMPELLEAYRSGGGVSWARFGADMIEGQAITNRQLFLSTLGREWIPQVGGVHEALTAGGRAADIGCGLGWSSIAIALAYPQATVDGFDLDEYSIDRARVHAAEMGVADRVTFHDRDAAEADPGEGYDLAIACECIHDMPQPVPVLATMRTLVGDRGTAIVVDEAADEALTSPSGPLEQALYGYSIFVCLPDGMSHPGSVGTGTVIRPSTLRRYAQEAGFADIEALPIEHEQFRVYRMVG
jgi:2-polyprenyl-3-methyl-5-hydroxy-6-metoxy-1,4-benzoquinol methylase